MAPSSTTDHDGSNETEHARVLGLGGSFEEGRLMHPTGSSTIPTRGFSDFEYKVRIIDMFGIVL